MQLTWMGTAALLLRQDETTLAVDPFPGLPLEEPVDRAVPAEDRRRFQEAGYVLVTHGHFDHIQFIPALYREKTCPVFATATPCRTMADHGLPRERLRQIAPGERLDLGPFHIEAYQGRHCKFDLPLVRRTLLSRRALAHPARLARLLRLNKAYDENGEILFYEITCGTLRLQIMGSLGLDADTAYPTGADWLILPFQGRSDLTEYAMPLVERLAPRGILLDHYDDAFPPMSATVDTAGFVTAAEKRLGIPCRALKKYETITL